MEKSRKDQLIGRTLAGRFQLVDLIGQGGMANVFLATDLEHNAPCAVKVLKSEFVQDEEFVKRFDAEAKAAASLRHENIVRVFGVGQDGDVRYITMQWIDGITLKEMIDRYGQIDWRVGIPIVIQIARALDAAHQRGIVHRDIKPHNIMVTPNHKAYVTDFGIARAATANTITLTGGSAMGSVHYFSPEQAKGTLVSTKSDIYSLGILMYELFTGQLPFDGDNSVSVALMHVQDEPIPPIELNPSIPKGLSDIILKCIRKNPAERYPSAYALSGELTRFQQHPMGQYGLVTPLASVDAPQSNLALHLPSDPFDKVWRAGESIRERKRKRRRQSILSLLLVLLSLVVLSVFLYFVAQALMKAMETPSSDEIIVLDNYQGKPFEEVAAVLDAEKLPYSTRQAFSADVPKGYVVEQNIPGGSQLKRFNLNELLLTVSLGSDSFVLPDLVGKKSVEVENQLRNQHGLIVEVILQSMDNKGKDEILRSDPPAGTEMKPGETIKLYVSTGPKVLQVPNLEGMSISEARILLSQHSLKLGEIKGDTLFYSKKDLIIKEQSPKPGTEVEIGDSVSVTAEPSEEARKAMESQLAEVSQPNPLSSEDNPFVNDNSGGRLP